jgi:Glycosyl transferase family 2
VSAEQSLDPGIRPAVSVIIPTYQRRENAMRAVQSVFRQTFRNFELIVVDDGSTDGTAEALAGLDPRLYYHWQENRGVGAARNAGITVARGEIVAFLDSDNRWLPHHLAIVTAVLNQNPEAVLVSTCFRFQPQGRDPAERAEVVDLLPRLLLGNPVGYVSCIAVRRPALADVGGFDERLPVWEDSDLWLRLAMHGPFCLIRCRTLIHQSTRGGLKERGLRSGEYLRAMEVGAHRALQELEGVPRPDLPELADRARAKLSLLAAMRAFARGASADARNSLEEACRFLPDLSHDPRLVTGLLSHGASTPRDAVDTFASAASLWPDPRSDTALFLRAWAAVVALRTRRWQEAGRLAAHRGFLARPGFAIRTLPITAQHLRGWMHAHVHGGQETALAERLSQDAGAK